MPAGGVLMYTRIFEVFKYLGSVVGVALCLVSTVSAKPYSVMHSVIHSVIHFRDTGY